MNDEDQNRASWDMLSYFSLGVLVAAVALAIVCLSII